MLVLLYCHVAKQPCEVIELVSDIQLLLRPLRSGLTWIIIQACCCAKEQSQAGAAKYRVCGEFTVAIALSGEYLQENMFWCGQGVGN